jgi:hypothetical protein
MPRSRTRTSKLSGPPKNDPVARARDGCRKAPPPSVWGLPKKATVARRSTATTGWQCNCLSKRVPKCNLGTRGKGSFLCAGKKYLEFVDSVRSREPSPYEIAFGDSILTVPNGQDSTSSG